MGLRVCLVTPFAWSRPHDVNEHVAGLAAELRALGHEVTVLAPSTRAADLIAGRRALLDGGGAEVIALGPAVPVSRRSRIGVPVGVRANLSLALVRGAYDVVHGFEPGLPSLSYLALRDAQALAVATFLSRERLGYPPGRAQRERLLGRIDALLATSEEVAEAAAERLPGDYRVVSAGVDTELFQPGRKRTLVVYEWRPTERLLARAVARALRGLPEWELVLLRTKPLTGRPTVSRALRGRAYVRTLRAGEARASLLNEAAVFVPAFDGLDRVSLEAAAAGAAIVSPPGVREQPELAAAAIARLAEDAVFRERSGTRARAEAEQHSFQALAHEVDAVYQELAAKRKPRVSVPSIPAEHDWITADLHLHTSWSHDCQISVEELLDRAEEQGLGAIAVTDHNVFGGALEAVEAQGAIVYLPHPFDRLHAIPDPATLHRNLAQLDVLEVYNARLLFEAYNDEALRFARKYGLAMGAGSDAHVLQGVGTGGVRLPAFDGPEEFLAALRLAQIQRRPRSLLYLQSLKWAAQAKERVR